MSDLLNAIHESERAIAALTCFISDRKLVFDLPTPVLNNIISIQGRNIDILVANGLRKPRQ
jgi:hypothetical protein